MSNYFTSNDYDKLIYMQAPKILIHGEKYKKMSDSAKILYVICFDLIKLSMQNHGRPNKYGKPQVWKDENGFFIRLTVDAIMKVMNCASQKAVKLKKELEQYELLTQKIAGLNQANFLYVMKLEYTENDIFTANKIHEDLLDDAANPSGERDFENQNAGILKIKKPAFRKSKSNNNKLINNQEIKNIEKDLDLDLDLQNLEKKEENQEQEQKQGQGQGRGPTLQEEIEFMHQLIWGMNVPMQLKRFFKDKYEALNNDPTFDLLAIEMFYQSQKQFISPKSNNPMYLNDADFSNMVATIYTNVKRPIKNMHGLLYKWALEKISFKMCDEEEMEPQP